MFETMLRDRVRGPEMPFAELRRGVTRVLQSHGDGGLLVEAVERGAVVIEIEATLKAPGHHAATRGHALRRRAVTMRRHHAAAGQCVEMRRFDVIHCAVDAEVRMAVIVSVNEDDVGLLGSLCENRKGTEEEKEEAIHGGG